MKKKTPAKSNGLATAAIRALAKDESMQRFPIQPPVLFPGVVPKNEKAPVLAMDDACYGYSLNLMLGSMFANGDLGGFPGYPYLAMLAVRAEYRNMVSALSTELTRKWISLNSSETAGESTKKKVTEIEQRIKELGLQQTIRQVADHDGFYGRGQVLIDLKGHDIETPLILDAKTIRKGSLKNFRVVEPMWTTPVSFNAIDPSAPDFYKPSAWWVMGQRWNATRMLTVTTREVPDMLKPAFNFSGISLSQLAEPYVNNWLRTRQSVSDLINNFSIVVLKTAMDQVLSGSDDGTDLFARIKLFTATRSNKGVMALDKDREELEQIAVPLGGLHELQSQAQEQMCSVSREPAIVMTGISPAGLNASSEGEIRIWYDWIKAQQEAYYRAPVETALKIIQLDMYGQIDPEISFAFESLYEMTAKELSEIHVNESIRAGNYIDKGVLDAPEERERLARDPESGYEGIDVTKEITPPGQEELESSLVRGNA